MVESGLKWVKPLVSLGSKWWMKKIIGVTKKLFGIRLYTEHNLSSNKGQLESEATQIFLI